MTRAPKKHWLLYICPLTQYTSLEKRMQDISILVEKRLQVLLLEIKDLANVALMCNRRRRSSKSGKNSGNSWAAWNTDPKFCIYRCLFKYVVVKCDQMQDGRVCIFALFGQNFLFVLGGLSRCFNCSIPRLVLCLLYLCLYACVCVVSARLGMRGRTQHHLPKWWAATRHLSPGREETW